MSKTQSWEAALEKHTQKVHEVSLSKVRRMVLETEMWRRPKAVSAQVMRTALHRFRSELTDAAFSLKPCACCTHGFVAKDLQTVRFPAFPFNTPDDLPELPDWLVNLDASMWKKHGAAWLKAVDTCFSTQTYLDVHFRRPEREAYAKARAKLLRAHSSPNAAAAADALLARVQVYFKNMKEDLDADAVSSPAGAKHPCSSARRCYSCRCRNRCAIARC